MVQNSNQDAAIARIRRTRSHPAAPFLSKRGPPADSDPIHRHRTNLWRAKRRTASSWTALAPKTVAEKEISAGTQHARRTLQSSSTKGGLVFKC